MVIMDDKKKEKLVPALRFGEFEGAWEMHKMKDVFSIFNGYAFSSKDSKEEGVRWVKIADVGIQKMKLKSPSFLPYSFTNKHKKFLLKEGDYVIALTRPILNGELKVARIDAFFHNSLLNQRVGKLESSNHLPFIYSLLQKNKLIKKIESNIAGTDPPNLSPKEINTLKVNIPAFPEQQKIANFLSAVDKKIEQLRQKVSLLEDYKKGMMQQLFSQQIRFKDDNGEAFGDWHNKKLEHFLSEPKKRNYDLKYDKYGVLSVSGKHGIVNQIEFQGRSFAGVSVANYHVVEEGDIVYTKSPLKANPYGIIKVNKGKAGIVSTLYAVYSCKENVSGTYLDYYFQLDDNLNRYLRPLVRKGAKNDMKINNSYVLSDYVHFPQKREQEKIVSFFESLDELIQRTQKQLDYTQAFKKGLLQQLFV